MISIPAIPPVGSVPRLPEAAPATGFAELLRNGLGEVSALEHQADALTTSFASGGGAQVHDVMAASAKAQLAVDLLVAVRTRAVEAYQEIMRLQV